MIEQARAAIHYLRRWTAHARADTRRLASEPRLSLVITRWAELRALADEMKAAASDLNRLINELSDYTLPQQLEAQNLDGVSHALGDVYLNRTFRVTQQKGKKLEIHAWLKANDFGALIVPTVNARTLAAALREPFEKGGLHVPSQLLSTSYRTYASFKKETDHGFEEESE